MIKPKIFVIVSNRENYYERLADDFQVDQAPWRDVEVVSHDDSLVFFIKAQEGAVINEIQLRHRSFAPDLILMRSYALGGPGHDWRPKLFTIMHSNIACINSLESLAFSVQKGCMWGKLRGIRGRHADFPLPAQSCYSSTRAAGFQPDFPTVLKIGSASQGLGKARVLNADQWKDSLSVLGMMDGSQYFTCEPYLNWTADIRVQLIGDVCRAIARKKTGTQQSSWKANEAFGITEEDVPVEPRWRRWALLCREYLKMDILGLDIITNEAGVEFILECNGSSIGFPPRHREEDVSHICKLVRKRAIEIFQPVVATLETLRPFRPRWKVHVRHYTMINVSQKHLQELYASLAESLPLPQFNLPCEKDVGPLKDLVLLLLIECGLVGNRENELLLKIWNLLPPIYGRVLKEVKDAGNFLISITNCLELMQRELKLLSKNE